MRVLANAVCECAVLLAGDLLDDAHAPTMIAEPRNAVAGVCGTAGVRVADVRVAVVCIAYVRIADVCIAVIRIADASIAGVRVAGMRGAVIHIADTNRKNSVAAATSVIAAPNTNPYPHPRCPCVRFSRIGHLREGIGGLDVHFW